MAVLTALRPLNDLYGGSLGMCTVSDVAENISALGGEGLERKAFRTCTQSEGWHSQIVFRVGNLVAMIYGLHESRTGLEELPALASRFEQHILEAAE